jgi:gliding motility-associated-like protein
MKHLDVPNFVKMNILNPLMEWQGLGSKRLSLALKTITFFSIIFLLSGFVSPDPFKSLSTNLISNSLNFNGIDAGQNVAICLGDTAQLLATGGTDYTWTPTNGLSCSDCPDPKAFPDTTTLYFVSSDDGNGNICTDSVTVFVSAAPQIDDVNTTNLTGCDEMDGIITVLASGGTGSLEYSINNGFSWQANNTFSSLNPGVYNVAIRNDNGTCVVFGDEVILTAPNAPVVTNVITNDPTQCDLPNGTIVITANGGNGSFEYSVDNGNNWQTLNTFQFLNSGFYQILVRNDDGSCTVSGGMVNLMASSDEPSISAISLFSPTDCGAMNGIITVSLNNSSSNFEYSNDGGVTWQASNSFTNLSAGNYDIRVRRDNETCEVTGGIVNLLEPETPVIDSVNFQDPSACNVEDGSIVINSSGGNGFIEYSVDGGNTWSFINTFGNLAGGNYTPAVRNANTNCITVGNPITLTLPSDDPIINLIQPFDPSDCVANDGSIIISATPCGSNILEYSIDGGNIWQLSETFAGLSGGIYQIVVRNQGSAVNINGGNITLTVPPTPIINEIQSTQPTCTGTDGSITIVATGNLGNLEYTIDGGANWQVSNSFQNLPIGVYTVVVRFPNSSCESDSQSFSLTPSDGPTIDNVIIQNDCDGSSGAITIVASGNGDLEYTIDGGSNWATTNFFSGLGSGTYSIGIREVISGCEILGSPATIALVPPPSITGVTFNDPSDCGLSDGNISIVASGGSGSLEYSIDGGNTWTSSGNFSNLPADTYHVFIRNDNGTCAVEYALNPLVLEEPGDTPSIDNIQTNIPSACGLSDGFIIVTASGNGTIEYSINGGLDYQLSPTFTNLGPGAYDLTVRFVGSDCENSNSFILGGQTVCVDTVQVSIPFETTTVECLDPSVFQISGIITSASFCALGNPNTVIAAALDDECVTLDPAGNYVGTSPDLLCVIHCFDNDPNNCDTTIIEVTVEPEDCSDFISAEMITQPFTGNPTEVCVPIAITQAASLNMVLDGQPYLGGFSGCDLDSVVVYTYSFLFGGGFSGPYNLDSWVCNGGTFSGQFEDANELVDLMNAFDPAGMWTININTSTISGGASGGNYGDMNITHIQSGTQSVLMTNFTIFANGTQINVNNIGTHEFIVIDPNTGCQDTISITLTGQLPTIDTITISTLVNTPSEAICVNGDELPTGFINSLGFCDLPSNGGAPLVVGTDSCVTYIPNTDFVGLDTFCILVCDNSNPPICDSTFVFVKVEAPSDTVLIDLPNQNPIDTCLTEFIQILSISTADICDVNTGEIEANLNNDCITLDPADGFIGETEICVVHCDDSNPSICDTTILIITVADPCSGVDIIPIDEITIESNDNPTEICVPISLADAELLEFEINGNPYSEVLTSCTPEAPFTDGTVILVSGPGTYELLAADTAGCIDILTITVDSAVIIDCDPIFTSDSLTIESPDGNADFCMPIPFDEIDNYTISIGGGLVMNSGACDNGLGTQISFDAFGNYEIIVTDTSDCSDTIVVDIVQEMLPPTDIDTIFVTTEMNVTIDEICIESDDLTDPIANIGFCELPANGSVPVVPGSDSCVSYIPTTSFVGFDEFCVVVCDASLPANCDTVLVIVAVTPPEDIVFIEAPSTQPFDTCLNSTILQLPGNIANTEVCGIFMDTDVTIDEECVTIDLADDFVGMTQVCVVHCDDSTPQFCDTTILVINYNPVLCDPIFNPDELTIVSVNPDVDICLPIPPTEIDMFDVSVDGMPYTGGFSGCDADSVHVYSYALVFGQGNDGPYNVTWNANGQQNMATVQDIAELVDSMNVWDPNGDWMDAMMANTLVSSNDDGDYGQLVFVHVGTMITTTVQSNFIGIPMGTQIIVNGFGDHVITVQNTMDGCSDDLNVLIIDEGATLDILTQVNTVSDTFCLDTTDLTGVNAFVVCETPNNGTINIIGFDCFTYTPDFDYEGLDTACVAVCDTSGFCDTTYVFITVESLCSDFDFFGNDTLNLMADNCGIPVEYCLPIPLDEIGNLSILDNGNVYSGGFQGCDNDTCLAYTYFTIPGLGNAGPYFLNSWTIDGLGTFEGQFEDIEALVDSMNMWDNMGTWELNEPLFLITNCNTTNTYSDIDVNQISTGANAIAELNIQLFPNGTQIQIDTGFHELIFIDMMIGCEDTLLVQVDCEFDDGGCGILALSDDLINVSDCDTTVQFCVDISIFDIGNFTITDNGAAYTGAVETCDLDPTSVAMVLDTGFHQLILADTVKNCADTFDIVVSCATVNDVIIEEVIPVGETVIFCVEDFGVNPSVVDSINVTCIDMQTGNANFVIDQTDWCLEITGISVGLDTSCFKVFFADTCFTIDAFIEVTAPCSQDLFSQDNIGQNLMDCSAGSGEICLPVSLIEMQNQFIQVNGVPYTDGLSGCNFDSTFTINCALLPSGGNLGPYILDSWMINGNDTTGVFEDCEELKDLMNELDPTGNWERVGDLIVGGDPNSTYSSLEVTQDVTGATASLGINSSFIPLGTAMTLPIGTFSVTFQDTLTGCRDTLITTIDCLNTEIFEDIIQVGQIDTLCFDTTELIGNFEFIANACEDSSGEFVVFDIFSDTCITYLGIEPGLDSACIILCDDLGLCDTTYVFITVVDDNGMLPIATNDTVVTGSNLPIAINVFGNDTIFNVQDFFILETPDNGDVTFLNDGTINYVPNPDFCDSVVPDSFSYVICNPIGCDTATVYVFVECTELIIFDGFSPNNDGINDVFIIQGLNLFGDHKLLIFNRWGERVFESDNYQNNWDGTWDGKDLPDGTYFFMLEIDGADTRTGYVQLNR